MSACIINESGNIFRNHSRRVIHSMQKPTGGTINTLLLIFKHVARDEEEGKRIQAIVYDVMSFISS